MLTLNGNIIGNPLFKQLLLLILLMSLFSCTGKRPLNLGIKDDMLATCPSTPNCVSSDALDKSHYIDPYKLKNGTENSWQTAIDAVLALPRTQIINKTDKYLHAECSSAVFGFVDDLELHLRTTPNIIAVRSASRLGSSDFGVNRSRVERIRQNLIKQGLISQ